MTTPRPQTIVPRPRAARAEAGITILEMMIVMAIIGLGFFIGYSGLRKLTRADLVEDATRLGALMARASELASESGKLHRLTIDLDKQVAVVEECEGLPSVRRLKSGEKVLDDKEAARKIEDAKARLKANQSSQPGMQGVGGARGFHAATPADDAKMAQAIAGHHVGDQTCEPVKDVWSGDAEGKPLILPFKKASGIKVREVWVQHRDDSITTGQVSIYFFPIGSAEKAVIAITDGGDDYAVKVHGLTGEIEVLDGKPTDVEDFMMKNLEGDREAPR